jgi:hypothetical protein
VRGSKPRDPARVARDRLLRLERQARARAEAHAVAEGVAETVALSRARGQAIASPPSPSKSGGGKRAQPYRRQTGLEWLAGRGRLDAAARAAGERYGLAYRRAKGDASIPSTLDLKPGRGAPRTAPLDNLLSQGEATAAARRRLAEFRARLWRQPDLVAACDLICGEEKTPREAAAAERDAARLEAVLKVALDILAGA